MYCSKCGKEIPKGSSICSECNEKETRNKTEPNKVIILTVAIVLILILVNTSLFKKSRSTSSLELTEKTGENAFCYKEGCSNIRVKGSIYCQGHQIPTCKVKGCDNVTQRGSEYCKKHNR